jgi:integral membrane sensor domain MASE1
LVPQPSESQDSFLAVWRDFWHRLRLLWLTVLFVGIAIYLAMFVAAWAAIWVIAKWFLSEFFRF